METFVVDAPEVRYAKSGDVNIAYGVVGYGPFDLVFIVGAVFTTLEHAWEGPPAEFFSRLASFCRLIIFDKRGTGLSDRVVGIPDLESRMDDVRAVMDAAGSKRAAIMGVSEGGPMTLLFAATYPERIAAAILFGTQPNFVPQTEQARDERLRAIAERERRWGADDYLDGLLEAFAPSLARDAELRRWWRRYARTSASPRAAADLQRMNLEIDASHVLSAIRSPTLVLHRRGDREFDIADGRAMADAIPGAEFVELEGEDHAWFVDPEQIAREVARFLSGIWERGEWDLVEMDRVLATVLFTDIVGSTERAVELGDRQWREILQRHPALIRRHLVRFRGSEMDTAGDGFFASFDGPVRAIRCACAIRDSLRELGLEVRIGLHTGECEVLDGKVSGIAVHIGSRIAAEAAAGEVLVSSTVKDIVAGSGIAFRERGTAKLKGVPGEWRLFEVEHSH